VIAALSGGRSCSTMVSAVKCNYNKNSIWRCHFLTIGQRRLGGSGTMNYTLWLDIHSILVHSF